MEKILSNQVHKSTSMSRLTSESQTPNDGHFTAAG